MAAGSTESAGPEHTDSAHTGPAHADPGPTADALLREGAAALSGSASPAADAALLLAHAWDRTGAQLARARLMGESVAPRTARAYRELLTARADGAPVQHLTGRAPFRRLTLPVGPGVFVPRPETELLVDAVLARTSAAPVAVDLCAGSGAIGLALATEAPGARVLGIERSEAALEWARRARAEHADELAAAGSRLLLAQGDATQAAEVAGLVQRELGQRPQVVVSNPPYVPPGAASAEVTASDPAAALWGGGPDGTEIPRRIIATAAALLAPGGLLVLEHAEAQGPALRRAAHALGFGGAATHSDYTGRDRYTTAHRMES